MDEKRWFAGMMIFGALAFYFFDRFSGQQRRASTRGYVSRSSHQLIHELSTVRGDVRRRITPGTHAIDEPASHKQAGELVPAQSPSTPSRFYENRLT